MLAVSIWFSLQAYQEAVAYEQSTKALVAHMGAKEQAAYRLKEMAQRVTFGWYKNDNATQMQKIKKEITSHKKAAVRDLLYVAAGFIVLLASYFFVSLRSFTFFGTLAALTMLIFGLITPILMVTIHKEVKYLGDVVLSFESKGVISSIEKLMETGDLVVAGVIVLFSVVMPFVKILSLLFITISKKNRFAHKIVNLFKHIGKWSMVDVFVVAIFLVYLSANKGGVSRAEVEVGLYFFLGYVIISMLVSLSADKMLHAHTKV